jgi:hypothetical protein
MMQRGQRTQLAQAGGPASSSSVAQDGVLRVRAPLDSADRPCPERHGTPARPRS